MTHGTPTVTVGLASRALPLDSKPRRHSPLNFRNNIGNVLAGGPDAPPVALKPARNGQDRESEAALHNTKDEAVSVQAANQKVSAMLQSLHLARPFVAMLQSMLHD